MLSENATARGAMEIAFAALDTNPEISKIALHACMVAADIMLLGRNSKLGRELGMSLDTLDAINAQYFERDCIEV